MCPGSVESVSKASNGHLSLCSTRKHGDQSYLTYFRICLEGFPEIGDEIAVYDADRNMVSSVAWRPEQKGHAGLAIWGDDETTSAKEGMSKGESFSIMYYDKSEDRLQPVEVKRWERGSDVFIKDGVSVVGSLSLTKN